jgi:hypothetical protein
MKSSRVAAVAGKVVIFLINNFYARKYSLRSPRRSSKSRVFGTQRQFSALAGD